MTFLQQFYVMITSLIILYTVPSTTSITPDAPTMILIDGICLNTYHTYYCEQSIVSSLDKPHAEITTIAKISAFNAFYIAKSTISLIRDEFLPKANTQLAQDQLHTCIGVYNGLENYLGGAYKAMLQSEYAEVKRYQSYVLGLLDNCKTDFDIMVKKNWWTRLYINTSIQAALRLLQV